MGTARTLPTDNLLRNLRTQIERQRNQVLDDEIVVDDCRRALDHALEHLRVACRQRDQSAEHLAQLIDWYDEIGSISLTFGPEIAVACVTPFEAHS